MSRSVLLQLARDSIAEVFEAQRTIDKETILQTHPLLSQEIGSCVNLYLQGKLRGTASTEAGTLSLLEAIIKNSKQAAFEDKEFSTLSTSEYLDCEVEIVLYTQEETISQRDPAILSHK